MFSDEQGDRLRLSSRNARHRRLCVKPESRRCRQDWLPPARPSHGHRARPMRTRGTASTPTSFPRGLGVRAKALRREPRHVLYPLDGPGDKGRTSRSVSGGRTVLPQPRRTSMLTTRSRRAEHHTLATLAGLDPLLPKARDTQPLDDESPNKPEPHRHRLDTTEILPRGASNSAAMLPSPRFAPLEPNRRWKRSNHRTSTGSRVAPLTDGSSGA